MKCQELLAMDCHMSGGDGTGRDGTGGDVNTPSPLMLRKTAPAQRAGSVFLLEKLNVGFFLSLLICELLFKKSASELTLCEARIVSGFV